MSPDPVVRVLLVVATFVLIGILGLTLWTTSQSNDISSVNRRLEAVERSLNYNSCLLLILPEEREELAITRCQAEGDE